MKAANRIWGTTSLILNLCLSCQITLWALDVLGTEGSCESQHLTERLEKPTPAPLNPEIRYFDLASSVNLAMANGEKLSPSLKKTIAQDLLQSLQSALTQRDVSFTLQISSNDGAGRVVIHTQGESPLNHLAQMVAQRFNGWSVVFDPLYLLNHDFSMGCDIQTRSLVLNHLAYLRPQGRDSNNLHELVHVAIHERGSGGNIQSPNTFPLPSELLTPYPRYPFGQNIDEPLAHLVQVYRGLKELDLIIRQGEFKSAHESARRMQIIGMTGYMTLGQNMAAVKYFRKNQDRIEFLFAPVGDKVWARATVPYEIDRTLFIQFPMGKIQTNTTVASVPHFEAKVNEVERIDNLLMPGYEALVRLLQNDTAILASPSSQEMRTATILSIARSIRSTGRIFPRLNLDE